jgi:hypothetical protein
MHSSSSNSRGSGSRPRQPRLDGISPDAHPQTIVSPTFLQSPSGIPPQAFLSPFPIPQYDHPSHPSSLLPANWQRPRATSSYRLESPTLAFPEPQLHRATSTKAPSRPPSPPPRTSRHDLGASPPITPALSHRSSVTDSKIHSPEVAFEPLRREVCRLCIFSSSK